MKRQTNQVGVAEIGPSFFERSKNKLLATAVIGSLAVSGAFAALSPRTAAAHPDRAQGTYLPQPKEFGVVTDIAEKDNIDEARSAVGIIKAAGFTSLTETIWIPPGAKGLGSLSTKDQRRIKYSLQAATEQELPVHIYLWQEGWVPQYRLPTQPTEQTLWCRTGYDIVKEFPIITKARVGVEWNNPALAHPQFIDGVDAVAKPYESLLASCYTLLHKAADERGAPITVVGGELAPAGNDDPASKRPSHSPITEIANICAAYKQSGRQLPIMDEFGMHWYPQSGESTPISHPNTNTIGIGDYDKLLKALGCFSFAGSGQEVPPISWDEGGVPTIIPPEQQKPYAAFLSSALSELIQAQFMVQAITEFTCNQDDAVELDNMFYVDDGSALSTGYAYAPPASPRQNSLNSVVLKFKTHFKPIHAAMMSAENGTLVCDK